jgi:hypothetical protein
MKSFCGVQARGAGGHSRRIRAIWKASLPEQTSQLTTFKLTCIEKGDVVSNVWGSLQLIFFLYSFLHS